MQADDLTLEIRWITMGGMRHADKEWQYLTHLEKLLLVEKSDVRSDADVEVVLWFLSKIYEIDCSPSHFIARALEVRILHNCGKTVEQQEELMVAA